MRDRLGIHFRRRRRARAGWGALVLYWLALTIVYAVVGVVGVWIVLGLAFAAIVTSARVCGRRGG